MNEWLAGACPCGERGSSGLGYCRAMIACAATACVDSEYVDDDSDDFIRLDVCSAKGEKRDGLRYSAFKHAPALLASPSSNRRMTWSTTAAGMRSGRLASKSEAADEPIPRARAM